GARALHAHRSQPPARGLHRRVEEDLGIRGRVALVSMATAGMAKARCRIATVLLAVGIGHVTCAGAAVAQPAPPQLTAPVNDFAHVIDEGNAASIDRSIRSLKSATGDVMVVATVPTFAPYGSIDEYAVKMFENGGRGIGDKGKDNGLLIVVAVKDRALRIEVGYGLEGIVPDGFAGEVRDIIRPKFREGRYGEG